MRRNAKGNAERNPKGHLLKLDSAHAHIQTLVVSCRPDRRLRSRSIPCWLFSFRAQSIFGESGSWAALDNVTTKVESLATFVMISQSQPFRCVAAHSLKHAKPSVISSRNNTYPRDFSIPITINSVRFYKLSRGNTNARCFIAWSTRASPSLTSASFHHVHTDSIQHRNLGPQCYQRLLSASPRSCPK